MEFQIQINRQSQPRGKAGVTWEHPNWETWWGSVKTSKTITKKLQADFILHDGELAPDDEWRGPERFLDNYRVRITFIDDDSQGLVFVPARRWLEDGLEAFWDWKRHHEKLLLQYWEAIHDQDDILIDKILPRLRDCKDTLKRWKPAKEERQ